MSSSERSLMATTRISEPGLVAMIRNTSRPILPNPLIATFTISLSSIQITGDSRRHFHHPMGIPPTVVEPGDGLHQIAHGDHGRQAVEDARVGVEPDVGGDDRVGHVLDE